MSSFKMGIENLLKRGKKFVKNGLAPLVVSSAIFLSSCGDSSGDGKNGKNSGSPTANGGTQIVSSHVVSGNEVSNYSPTTGTIYFSSPVNFNNGEIVASGITSAAPNGFLRKISSMSADKKTIYTQIETLENAVKDTGKDIAIVINPTPLHPTNAGFSRAKDGINPLSYGGYDFGATLDNFVLFDLDDDPSTTDDQVNTNGYLLFNTGFSLVLDIRKNSSPYFSFENISSEELSIQVSSLNSFNNMNKEIMLGEYSLGPRIIGYIPTVIPIPIIAVPQVEIYANLSGNISTMEMSVHQSASVTGRIEYNQSWSFDKIFSKSFGGVPPSLPKSASFKASLTPRLNFLFYGVAGPYGEVDGIMDFHLNGSSWELHGGLEALVGVDGDILGSSFNYSKKVLEFDQLLVSGVLGTGGGGGGNPTPTTINIPASQDAFVRRGSIDASIADTNYNTDLLEFGTTPYSQNSFIQFSFSQIPFNSTITSAKLNLYGYCVNNYSSPINTSARKVLGDWSESSITWNNSPSYGSAGSTLSVPNSGASNWSEWDVKSLVQGWINGTSSNYGLALYLGGNESECKFKSSEYSDSSLRPKLVITYY